MNKTKLIECNSILLHTVIKSEIESSSFKSFIQELSNRLPILLENKECQMKKLSFSELDKIAKKIIALDSKGVLVYSCLSLSVLIHVYLCCANIRSKIVIGSCVVCDKVYSHAWVETSNGYLFDYRYDTFKYKPIKVIDILGEDL